MTPTVTCTRCHAPVPVNGDRVGRHKEQIVAATPSGFVDGYHRCESIGQRLSKDQQAELLAQQPAPLMETTMSTDTEPPVITDRAAASVLTTYHELAEVVAQLHIIVKSARRIQGLSLRGLSAITGLTPGTLARVEQGESLTTGTLLVLLQWLSSIGTCPEHDKPAAAEAGQ